MFVPPSNVTVMGNNSGYIEGTMITYYCQQPGNEATVEPVVAICTRDGYWSPNPDELESLCNLNHTMTASTNIYSPSSAGIYA